MIRIEMVYFKNNIFQKPYYLSNKSLIVTLTLFPSSSAIVFC
jgi:hypothetical protein